MRMWMIEPRIMCRAHLLGEHRELHALCGMLRSRISLDGYHEKGLLELAQLGIRHEALVKEMLSRGYEHRTPFDGTNARVYTDHLGTVDRAKSFIDLMDRCPNCVKRAIEFS